MLRVGLARLTKRLMALDVAGVQALPLRALAKQANRMYRTASLLAEVLEPPRPDLPGGSPPASDTRRRSQYRSGELRRIARALHDLVDLCESDAGAAAESGALLVTGGPGQGKTHLFCDVAEKRASQGLITVLLMGQHFAQTGSGKQIANLVGVPAWDRERLLDALEKRARSTGRPALLMVDALNEGGGLDLWPRALARLIRDVRARPWVALAVSCRTQYVDLLLNPVVRQRVHLVQHMGFRLREDEASAQFFTYFGLPLPRVPLLLPEYSHPLLLKLLCRALQRKRLTLSALGKEGIWYLYERFCFGVGDKIADDLRRPDANRIPWDSAKAIAKELAEVRRETVPRRRALELIAVACRGKADPARMLAAMVDEGLLAEDVSAEAGSADPVIRFPYQQFSQHLIARYVLDAYLDKNDPQGSFAPGTPLGDLASDERTARRNAGLIEALAIQLPEHAPVELADLVANRAKMVVDAATIESIKWRKVHAFRDVPALLTHINAAIRRRVEFDDFLSGAGGRSGTRTPARRGVLASQPRSSAPPAARRVVDDVPQPPVGGRQRSRPGHPLGRAT